VQVPNTPGSGKCIAKAKGVRGDAESKGRRRQTSGPTNRNRKGILLRIRLLDKLKSNSYTETASVNADRWRERLCSYPGRSHRRKQVDINELGEVSRMNTEKSKVVSVVAIRDFKFLGFALGRSKNGYFIRAHAKSLKRAKTKLRELTFRSQGRNVREVMQNV